MMLGALNEYWAVRKRVGWLEGAQRGLVRVSGGDRAVFLHNLLSNDIKRLPLHHGCQAMLLNAQGRIEADCVVWALPDAHLVETSTSVTSHLAETLERYHVTEDVSIVEQTGALTWLALQGPQAAEICRQLGCPFTHLTPWEITTSTIAGGAVTLMRRSTTGEDGCVVWCETQRVAAIRQALDDAGAAIGLVAVGETAMHWLRIEAGIPWYGMDMDHTTLLPETGLTQTFSETKGCYLGQEIVARIMSQGHVHWQLAGFRIPGQEVPPPGTALYQDDQVRGRITSSCYSPHLNTVIALGYAHRTTADPGTQLTWKHNGQSVTVTVDRLPFYHPTPCLSRRSGGFTL